MSPLDTEGSTAPATRRAREYDTLPAIGGVPVTDLSALVGGLAWIVGTVVGELGAVERAVALAPLVLVPLGMRIAANPPYTGNAGGVYRIAALLQPFGALLVLASLFLPERTIVAALLGAAWLPVSGLLALAGGLRVADRGIRPLGETVIDAGFAYTTVGATALVLYHLELFFWFSPIIILLTAVHFHYAGFALAVVTGMAGRCVPESRLFDGLASVVLAGPAIIAVGISFSQTVEVIAVAVFTIAVGTLGGFVLFRVVPNRPRLQGAFLTVSALTLPISMLLALGFVLAVSIGFNPLSLTISRMVALHGTLNAFGFALLGLLGWRLAVPTVRSRTGSVGR